jgi:Ankyrin repeats (3 copies)
MLPPAPENENHRCPHETVMQLVRSQGIDVDVQDSLSMKGFFSEYTCDELGSYDTDVLIAIRTRDVEKLRDLHNSGRPLKCSNNFGESLLHMACRRGFVEVVAFLIHEAKVPVRLCDDYGRTILHDAAWNCEPNFELIQLILTECPDLLFMRDRRGHTPVAYARKSHWAAWNAFLTQHPKLLIPAPMFTNTESCI